MAVFTAIAIPIVTVGYIHDGALSLTYTLIGIALGLIAGLIAAKVVKKSSPPVPSMAIEEAQKIRETVSAGADTHASTEGKI